MGYAVANGSVHTIWSANFRPTEAPEAGDSNAPRPKEVRYESYKISVPATHKPGNIEWPQGTPSAFTDFVTLAEQDYADSDAFTSSISAADTSNLKEAFLFVHGFNMNHDEAVYQLAQVAHDFELTTPAIVFSWPSAASPSGYLYDRDSALIARDKLEQLIIDLTKEPGRKLVLFGHSMGNFLIMETLRQIKLSGSVDITVKLSALIMVSPDIDGELFQTQVGRMKEIPQPFFIAAAKQDRALRLSAFLTGRANRLGSQTDRDTVKNLPITVIDVSALGDGGIDHSIAFTSPSAISILKRIRLDRLPKDIKISPLIVLERLGL